MDRLIQMSYQLNREWKKLAVVIPVWSTTSLAKTQAPSLVSATLEVEYATQFFNALSRNLIQDLGISFF